MTQTQVRMAEGHKPLEEEDLVFLIGMLDISDKEEFVDIFSEEVSALVTKGARSRLLHHQIHISDEKMLIIIENNEKAMRWLVNKVKEKMEKAKKILASMEAEEE